ncbi:hypothetical protein SBD_3323 [Streptomyces bottropensis ATCC 25435]|uniref:Uncharacterized protein n=1 Tax=Streptomyces bottropensis ATCC 25435 TaxID=1054862 RepID=M3FSQ3_9ACTN|nr:hypothetical protein SBD_3323 [Streptomyces bottropensis ATCC 25435]
MRSWREANALQSECLRLPAGAALRSNRFGEGDRKEGTRAGQRPYQGLTTRLVDNRFQIR